MAYFHLHSYAKTPKKKDLNTNLTNIRMAQIKHLFNRDAQDNQDFLLFLKQVQDRLCPSCISLFEFFRVIRQFVSFVFYFFSDSFGLGKTTTFDSLKSISSFGSPPKLWVINGGEYCFMIKYCH